MTAVAEYAMELEIKVQGMTCDGRTSRAPDTLQVKMHMSLSASRPPRWPSGQAVM